MQTEDKGKSTTHDQSDLLGVKPFAHIGGDRTPEEAKVVGKLKKKKAEAIRAEGSTVQSGEQANMGDVTTVSKAIGHFVNR